MVTQRQLSCLRSLGVCSSLLRLFLILSFRWLSSTFGHFTDVWSFSVMVSGNPFIHDFLRLSRVPHFSYQALENALADKTSSWTVLFHPLLISRQEREDLKWSDECRNWKRRCVCAWQFESRKIESEVEKNSWSSCGLFESCFADPANYPV